MWWQRAERWQLHWVWIVWPRWASRRLNPIGTKMKTLYFFQKMNPIVGRLVPLAAVAAANCINIPLMRRQELQKGISLVDDNYNSLNVESRKAAVQGISAVIASRIAMATPGMGKFSWSLSRISKSNIFLIFTQYWHRLLFRNWPIEDSSVAIHGQTHRSKLVSLVSFWFLPLHWDVRSSVKWPVSR